MSQALKTDKLRLTVKISSMSKKFSQKIFQYSRKKPKHQLTEQ